MKRATLTERFDLADTYNLQSAQGGHDWQIWKREKDARGIESTATLTEQMLEAREFHWASERWIQSADRSLRAWLHGGRLEQAQSVCQVMAAILPPWTPETIAFRVQAIAKGNFIATCPGSSCRWPRRLQCYEQN